MKHTDNKINNLLKQNILNKPKHKNFNKDREKLNNITINNYSFKDINNEDDIIIEIATNSDLMINKYNINSETPKLNKDISEMLKREKNINDDKKFEMFSQETSKLCKKSNEISKLENKINITNRKFRISSSRMSLRLFLLLRTVFCVKLLFQCILLGMCASGVFGIEQKFAIEPQDQSAVVGSRVTLPCRVVNKSGQLQWTKDDFGLGTHRHLAGYERYKMIGSDDEGDYSLDIRDVTLEDDALYQCQVSTGPHGEQPIRSRYARLLILVPPETPRILQGTTIEAIEDQDLSLECISVGGKPAAEITWVDNEGGVLTQGVTYAIEPMSDGRRLTARSILSLRPRRHHHNQTFTCQAQNTADRAFKAASIRLQVKHAPKVRLTVKNFGPKDRIKEGHTVKLGCQAEANPSDMTYRWYINNEFILGNSTNELVIKNVSRKYNEGLVKCEVSNLIGKSADSKVLEISYGPRFLIKPEDIEAEEGSTATLNCIVDGHPHPDVFWLRYKNDRIVQRIGKSQNLTLSVNSESSGQYWCRASVEGYPDAEAKATVYVRGPPKIVSNKTQYGVEGDSVKIDCVSLSIPKPDYVIWTFGGAEINSYRNQEYAFLEDNLQDGMTKSTLIIRSSDSKHFGLYNCTVVNLYGVDTVQIQLIPDKSIPFVVLISGGASSAVVVLIIMLMIMLCHRKTRKSLPVEFDKKPDLTNLGKKVTDSKDCDRHSSISDLKLELRQVEGSCDADNSNQGSERDFNTHPHLNPNLGLPLAGPVSLPTTGLDLELMKRYQRYSNDFSDHSSIQFKQLTSQSKGYIPYVDYSRDYIPPTVMTSDSLAGSLTRSVDTVSTAPYGSQTTLQRMGQGGPDVIPMNMVDLRYAATYGNPYLRVPGPITFIPEGSSSSTHAPPPYYFTSKTSSLPHHTSTTSIGSPPSLITRTIANQQPGSFGSSSAINGGGGGAQPQVPKMSPQAKGALYVLPAKSQGNGASTQITTKNKTGNGTHV